MGQIAISGIGYERSVVEVVTQQVLLSGGKGMVLRTHCSNNEDLDRNHPENCSYFRLIYDRLKLAVMINENEEIVWKKQDAVDRRLFVGNVQIFSNKTATRSKSTELVARSVQAVLVTFNYISRRGFIEN